MQADSLPAEPQEKPKNTIVGSLSLLQGIFPTHRLNQGLMHCRWILYQPNSKGSTINLWSLQSFPFPLRSGIRAENSNSIRFGSPGYADSAGPSMRGRRPQSARACHTMSKSLQRATCQRRCAMVCVSPNGLGAAVLIGKRESTGGVKGGFAFTHWLRSARRKRRNGEEP